MPATATESVRGGGLPPLGVASVCGTKRPSGILHNQENSQPISMQSSQQQPHVTQATQGGKTSKPKLKRQARQRLLLSMRVGGFKTHLKH